MPRKKGRGRGRGAAGGQADDDDMPQPGGAAAPGPVAAHGPGPVAAHGPGPVAGHGPAPVPAPVAAHAPTPVQRPITSPVSPEQPTSIPAPGRRGRGRGAQSLQEPDQTQPPGGAAVATGPLQAPGGVLGQTGARTKTPAASVPLVGQTTAKTEEAAQMLSKVSLAPQFKENLKMPKRPGYGKEGQYVIRLRSNHYPLNLPDGNIYHYDVEIEPLRANITPEDLQKELVKKATPQQVSGKRLNVRMSREVMSRLFSQEALFNNVLPAYDGNKNMFTRRPVQVGNRTTKIVSFREDGRDVDSHFKVSIQPVWKEGGKSNEINLNCLHKLFKGQSTYTVDCYQAIMALDIIMRSGPALKLTAVGRSFFLPPRSQKDVHPLSEGKNVWFGHYQTIRPDQHRPVIILDKSATTFYEGGPLIEYICKFLNINFNDLVKLNDYQIKQLSNDLKNVQICVTHLRYRRKYRIVRFTKQSARELKFPETQKNGTVVQRSVEEYFRMNYKPLRFANLPCVQVNPENKKIYQPIEVCELVEGQHYKRKLTEAQTSEMIKFTCTTPIDRFNDIERACIQTVEDGRRYMTEFGLKMDTKPLHLEGRVLEAPKVVYGNQTIQPKEGSWDLRGVKFLEGAEIRSWVIVCMANDRFCPMLNLRKFADLVRDMASKMSMRMGNANPIMHLGNRGLPAVLKELKDKTNMDLVVIVLRDRSSYAQIKQVAEVELGLRTSCIQANNVVRKCNPQLVCNVLLKMNAKFDGKNSRLVPNQLVNILEEPVLIIGVDVSHSAPGDKVRPSVAAAVGSLDKMLHHYAACIKVQQGRGENKQHVEVIAKFNEMVKRLLIAFYKNTRQKPERIIIYRDGVSEGEFSTVCDFEIPKVDQACLELEKDGTYRPLVTFIVVQKRHHTRFAPENPREGVGRCKNVPPGTVVDKDVIHPIYHDYFLCSHFGIQGTSRPAHYTVLRDDNKLSADDLQKLSYHLCHTYVRCTRSISIPAPVMYAHLAAFRARHHLASVTADEDASVSSEGSSQLDDRTLESLQRSVEVMANISLKMYFI